MNKLKEYVLEDLEDYETKEDKLNYLKDVLNHGCQSGIVCGLIYYKDTNDFFDEYEEEIETLISEMMDSFGIETRPLFIESLNGSAENIQQEKNLLSWFAYEETARKVLEEDFGEDY